MYILYCIDLTDAAAASFFLRRLVRHFEMQRQSHYLTFFLFQMMRDFVDDAYFSLQPYSNANRTKREGKRRKN